MFPARPNNNEWLVHSRFIAKLCLYLFVTTYFSYQEGMQLFSVYESKEDGWLVGTLNGKTGLIPSNYVEPLP